MFITTEAAALAFNVIIRSAVPWSDWYLVEMWGENFAAKHHPLGLLLTATSPSVLLSVISPKKYNLPLMIFKLTPLVQRRKNTANFFLHIQLWSQWSSEFHFFHNVQTTNKLPFYIQLRISGPIRKSFQARPYFFIPQNIKR